MKRYLSLVLLFSSTLIVASESGPKGDFMLKVQGAEDDPVRMTLMFAGMYVPGILNLRKGLSDSKGLETRYLVPQNMPQEQMRDPEVLLSGLQALETIDRTNGFVGPRVSPKHFVNAVRVCGWLGTTKTRKQVLPRLAAMALVSRGMLMAECFLPYKPYGKPVFSSKHFFLGLELLYQNRTGPIQTQMEGIMGEEGSLSVAITKYPSDEHTQAIVDKVEAWKNEIDALKAGSTITAKPYPNQYELDLSDDERDS